MTRTALPRLSAATAAPPSVPNSAPHEAARRFLAVHLAPQQHAMLPTDSLIEVLTFAPDQIVTIPDTPAAVMGVCNWRGEVLWLLDGGQLLTNQPTFAEADYQTKFSVVVLQKQQRSLGLVVAQVANMLWCHDSEIQSGAGEALPPMVLGHWQAEKGEKIYVFDTAAIFNAFT